MARKYSVIEHPEKRGVQLIVSTNGRDGMHVHGDVWHSIETSTPDYEKMVKTLDETGLKSMVIDGCRHYYQSRSGKLDRKPNGKK
jgi:hypothetical protein